MQILLVALFFVDVKDISEQDCTRFFMGFGPFSLLFFRDFREDFGSGFRSKDRFLDGLRTWYREDNEVSRKDRKSVV